MAFLTALAAFLRAVGAFFGWKQQSDLIDAGRAQERAQASEERLKQEGEANAVRDTVRADISRDPGRELRDSFFRD